MKTLLRSLTIAALLTPAVALAQTLPKPKAPAVVDDAKRKVEQPKVDAERDAKAKVNEPKDKAEGAKDKVEDTKNAPEKTVDQAKDKAVNDAENKAKRAVEPPKPKIKSPY